MTQMEPARSPRRRAPRNSLNRELIIESALRLLEGKGIGAFTMRALAQDLGVGAMALYTYFDGKEQLFDAAREKLLGRYQPCHTGGSPRDQLREACLAVHRLFAEHPAVIELLISRPDRRDPGYVGVEHMVGLLRLCGLGPVEAVRAQTALMQYTLGVARWAMRLRECGVPEGVVGTEPQFEFGLEALLEGLVGQCCSALGGDVVDHGSTNSANG
jgi:AcrR family transcriptional regulator